MLQHVLISYVYEPGRMCGIAGYIGAGLAGPILLRALERLEYRGYDSAGVATIVGGTLVERKDAGKIAEINSRLHFDEMPGSVGIAHTRWATHGAPTKTNAHPHLDCDRLIAVVHNGVLENFISLKEELMEMGHTFHSKTDTEVVAHLIEEGLRKGQSIEEAFMKTIQRLEGSYALAVISPIRPDMIMVARKESPLIIGIGKDFNMVASDVTALLDWTKDVIFLENGEGAFIGRDNIKIFRIDSGDSVSRSPTRLEISMVMAEKGGFPHYMLKEIHEQPMSLRNALRLQEIYVDLVAELLDRGREIFLLGAGTSYNACLAASYFFSKLARISTYPVIASEFISNYGYSIGADTVILAVSQSGETADVLNALEFARLRASTILGVTNTVGSTLTRISRAYLLQNAGPEIGVAATKTFTSQVLVLAQLALKLARLRGKVAQYEMDEIKAGLRSVPEVVEKVVESVGPTMRIVAEKLVGSEAIFVLGRGVSSSVAMEGRLKMMELSYTPCIAYPAGESKHGPISVIHERIPVIFIVPPDETRKLNIGSIMEMKARGANIITLGDMEDQELRELSNIYIGLPRVHPLLIPIVYVIPFQFLSYYMALIKGHDPDKPRNLAKSVTVL
jgi:glucosamine--fructose-6-phosphate aminotransferase (isomerizing)